jgi:flagellar biosynthesis/type III secretory pathway chaperone
MLRNIPSSILKQLVRLSERKEALMAQIQEIDREMIRVQNKLGIPSREGDQPAPVTMPRAPRRSRGRRTSRARNS